MCGSANARANATQLRPNAFPRAVLARKVRSRFFAFRRRRREHVAPPSFPSLLTLSLRRESRVRFIPPRAFQDANRAMHYVGGEVACNNAKQERGNQNIQSRSKVA